jgi:hypothetical protein
MATRYYHVLAYLKSITDQYRPLDPEYQPTYLGKTTDLLMKTDPEKSVDLDDGSTMVGSEKLTLSFSALERVEPRAISEILLVPVAPASLDSRPGLEAVRVEVGEVKITPVETKTGEFERTQFSAVMRYAVETPAYEIVGNCYGNKQIHLFLGVSDGHTIGLRGLKEDHETDLAVVTAENFSVSGLRALICSSRGYGDFDVIELTLEDEAIGKYDENYEGVFVHNLLG